MDGIQELIPELARPVLAPIATADTGLTLVALLLGVLGTLASTQVIKKKVVPAFPDLFRDAVFQKRIELCATAGGALWTTIAVMALPSYPLLVKLLVGPMMGVIAGYGAVYLFEWTEAAVKKYRAR